MPQVNRKKATDEFYFELTSIRISVFITFKLLVTLTNLIKTFIKKNLNLNK
jgi:hypothetical protein